MCESISDDDAGSKLLAFTNSYTPPRTLSKIPSSSVGSQQAALLPTPANRTPPGDPLTLSPASVHHTPPPTLRRLSQCQVCIGQKRRMPACFGGRLIQIREKNFQARQMERQHWSPRRRDSQSPVTTIVVAPVFNAEEKPSSMNTTTARVSNASESEQNPGMSRDHKFLGTLIRMSLPSAKRQRDLGSEHFQILYIGRKRQL